VNNKIKSVFKYKNKMEKKENRLNKRKKNVIIEKQIVVGSMAFWQGKKSEEEKSHK